VAPRGTYVFDNAGAQAGARFSALGALFDPGTIRHLTELGVAEGWHCLEVGAGGGSIATWLCDRVGAAGHVVATDIDPRFLDAVGSPNLELRRHDIASDPLPEAAFDLVHARLVLVHLPERDAALRRIVRALKPGAGCSSRSSTRCRCSPIQRSIPTRSCSRPTMRCSG
jgi:ubiquinone/menaquinone biosynthesis C-methylase UbiE